MHFVACCYNVARFLLKIHAMTFALRHWAFPKILHPLFAAWTSLEQGLRGLAWQNKDWSEVSLSPIEGWLRWFWMLLVSVRSFFDCMNCSKVAATHKIKSKKTKNKNDADEVSKSSGRQFGCALSWANFKSWSRVRPLPGHCLHATATYVIYATCATWPCLCLQIVLVQEHL